MHQQMVNGHFVGPQPSAMCQQQQQQFHHQLHQQHQQQQMQWNNNNNNMTPDHNNFKFDRRKISVHENFYNYQMPFEQRSRQHHRQQMLGYSHSVPKQKSSENTWKTPTKPIRKTSMMDVHHNGTIFRKSSHREQMLSPPSATTSHMKQEIPSSPMEVDVVRKKSSHCQMDRKPSVFGVPMNLPSSSTAHLMLPKKSYCGHPNIPSRKASLMAAKSQLRAPRFGETTPYTPPPILSPMRNGSGLFWQIAKTLAHHNQTASTCSGDNDNVPGLFTLDDTEMSEDSPGLKLEDSGHSTETVSPPDSIQQNNQANESGGHPQPQRKNGFFYMATQMNQSNFADELEALRKESNASSSSQRFRSMEEVFRKSSEACSRKNSTLSNCCEFEDEEEELSMPRFTDANAHINIGSNYQAKVLKWKDRLINSEERNYLEDRDQLMFSPESLEGLSTEQIYGFEMLSCSRAIPPMGRNKELALHLLQENRGNIEAATADLLKADVLDWQQYPIVQATSYPDTSVWTPEEINAFQDAIYRTEKDFNLVAQEVGNKSIMECVEFYYTWKKCCPDDYRKLRNLRRKRQLLEINLNQMEDQIPMKKCSLNEKEEPEYLMGRVSTAPPYQAIQDYVEPSRPNGFFSQTPSTVSPLSIRDTPSTSSSHGYSGTPISPAMKEHNGIHKNYQPISHRSQHSIQKKGAQPAADGFFHCRLCDKCFEKVKSLNAHMKSHAMKARAEAEAKAQVEMAHQNSASSQPNNFHNGLKVVTMNNSMANMQGMSASPTASNIGINTSMLIQPGIGIAHPRPQHPILQQTHLSSS